MDILEEFNTEDLYVRYAVTNTPNDRDFTMHIHEQCEIYCFVSGNAEYLVEGAHYPLKSGNILIMRPAESHRAKILGCEKYERYALNFSLSITDKLDPNRILMKPFLDRPLGRGNLYSVRELGDDTVRFFAEMRSCGSEYEKKLEISTRLFLLLEIIYKAYIRRESNEYAPPTELSEQLVAYVNNHLFEELSVSLLAQKFFLSTSQISRIFRKATGASPWEYITIKRLTAAREKMRCGESAISAAESAGFGDYSSFYRAYIKRFGRPPKKDLR
ncbi:MAG: AraC family transcriptional regulator [Firmicutes bacterium]|nr:AraC family transcriptional regulator [[Eubacterium] siraeum]MCM1488497.1 AraC family transcriptional regulator [Bacillota bacterium]